MDECLEGKSLKPVTNMNAFLRTRAMQPGYRRMNQVMNEVSKRTKNCFGMGMPNQAFAGVNPVVALAS